MILSIPAQTIVEASGSNVSPVCWLNVVKAAKHVSSATGGTFTYRRVVANDPPEDVVPQPEVIVSSHPT